MKKKITIVDYGSGNLLSAKQSFIKVITLSKINAEIQISNDDSDTNIGTRIDFSGSNVYVIWEQYDSDAATTRPCESVF